MNNDKVQHPFALVLSNRHWITLATIILVAVAVPGLLHMGLKTDYRVFFSEDDPYLTNLDSLTDTYTSSDNIIFILAPKDKNVFSHSALQQQIEMTEEAWTLEYSTRTDSLINFQHAEADEDSLSMRYLVPEEAELTDSAIQDIRGIALGEDDLIGRLVDNQGSVAAVAVSYILPGESFWENINVAIAAREFADKYRAKYPDTDIYITGLMMANYTTLEILVDDNIVLVPLMFAVVIALLSFLFRSFYAALATVIVIFLSIIIGLGLSGWAGTYVSGPSSAAPIIILTIAVADCVHVLTSFYFLLSEGKSKSEAIIGSLEANVSPVLLTSITTAIGFLTLNFSNVPPFNVLGNMVAIGVGVACLASLTLLPVMMYWLPLGKNYQNDTLHLMAPFARHITQHPRRYFFSTALASLLVISFITENQLNDQFAKYFDKTREFRYSTEFANEHLSSIYDIGYSLKSPYEAGIFDVRYLNKLEEFSDWLGTQPEVVNVMSVNHTLKRLNKSMHADNEDWFKLPESNELSSQYFFLYEMSLPFGLSPNNQVSFDKTESKILITLKEQTTNQMLNLEKRFSQWLKDHAPEYEFYNASTMLMFSQLGVANAKSMMMGALGALALMSIITGIALRSWILSGISFVANMLPAALAFGVWGMLYGEVGLSIAIAISLTLGIVVDNTVHLLSKYKRAYKQSGDTNTAIEFAFSHVGIALLICNLVLVVGFVILAQSDFKLNGDLGYFTAITFVSALIIDFMALPPLLLAIYRKRSGNMVNPFKRLPH
ncbi:MAG: MMPL family transporter [Pseudomonadales bacterium]|nr:MMPL family transporter [Pseudomonadales bacterium]